MTYRSLLTHVVADRGCAARIRMTASVARAFSSEVIGLGAQAPWPYSDAGGGRGPQFQTLVQTALDDIASAERAFRAGLADPAIKTAWRSEIGYPNVALTRHARAADLVLAYRVTSSADLSLYAEPDSLVMEAGLPVLLMPARESEFKGEAVLVAWKNTREGRRAIGAALPALIRAKRVLVAAVCQADEIDAVERELSDVSQRLARHGVNATTLAEVDAPGAAGRKLLRIAQTVESDLIVAGAYGHSRLREWALGGVTRDLLADGRRYVLLSH
jgi:nucleotide-binding universal stress UspA family protein